MSSPWLVASGAGENRIMNWNKTLVLVTLFLIGLPCFAQPATISDLWFMRGKWRAELGDKSFVREEWVREDDKTLTGSCLFMEDSTPATSEAMRITETKDGMILTIKHTKKDGTPWKDEDEAGDLRLVEFDLTHAVFDNGNKKNRVKITYTKREEKQLNTLVEISKEGKQKKFSFDYFKEGPPAYDPGRDSQYPNMKKIGPNKSNQSKKLILLPTDGNLKGESINGYFDSNAPAFQNYAPRDGTHMDLISHRYDQ